MAVFGEDLIKKVFSKQWPIRDEGLKECEDFIHQNLTDDNSEQRQLALFQGALTAAGHSLDDKIGQVTQRGMSLL